LPADARHSERLVSGRFNPYSDPNADPVQKLCWARTIGELQQEGVAANLKIAGVIPNLFDRTAQSKEILEAVIEQFSGLAPVFSPVPRAVAFADASMQHVPLAVYDPKHPAIAVLDTIAQSLESL
jgi:chromosome partitioning protein